MNKILSNLYVDVYIFNTKEGHITYKTNIIRVREKFECTRNEKNKNMR